MVVGDKRKAIPLKVKLQVLIRQARCSSCGERLGSISDVEFDHRPALVARQFNETAGDFIPPQNDPEFLEAVHKDCHAQRTFGPGGESRITTRGSDQTETKRDASIRERHEEFRRRLLKPGKRKAKGKSKWPRRKMRG